MNNTLDFTWFDLAKYEPVKEFSLNDWYVQLSRRIGFKTFYNLDSPIIMVHLENISIIDTDRERIKNHPIDYKEHLERVWGKLEDNPILEPPIQINTNPVKLATYDNLPHETNNSDFELLKNFIDGCILSDFNVEYRKALDLSEASLAHHDKSLNHALISVDFNASEKELVHQFKNLVRKQQKLKKVITKKEFTEADISSWKEFNVLPCIDLLLYAELNGVSIEQNEIGHLLFPSEYDVTLSERVRKSVLPKAKKLLTPETIFAMQYQLSER